MDPLVKYYVRQAGGGRGDNGVGPIYISPPFVQRRHGIGSFFSGLFRAVRPILGSGAVLGTEALRTGGRILTGIADNPTHANVRQIISKNVTESLQNLSSKLRGQGRKRKMRVTSSRKPKRAKRAAPPRIKRRRRSTKTTKRHIFLKRISNSLTMSEAPSFVGTEFDIFAPTPVQSGVEQTIDTIYKPVASVDQSNLQFVIPGDPDTYLDLNIKLYVKDKLVKADGSGALDNTDFTAVTNTLLHSLFSQCSIILNGTNNSSHRIV
jgi:hypothetical protein